MQMCVDQQASLRGRVIDRQEGLARRKGLDDASVLLEHGASGLEDICVIVDDEHGHRLFAIRSFANRRCAGGLPRGEQCCNGRRQFFEIDRLVELHAVGARNLSERLGRDITS